MTKEDVRNFMVAINTAQPFVPPVIFAHISGSPVIKFLDKQLALPTPQPNVGGPQPGFPPLKQPGDEPKEEGKSNGQG